MHRVPVSPGKALDTLKPARPWSSSDRATVPVSQELPRLRVWAVKAAVDHPQPRRATATPPGGGGAPPVFGDRSRASLEEVFGPIKARHFRVHRSLDHP